MNERETLVKIILTLLGGERVIAFSPLLMRITGRNANVALLLCQLLYWAQKMNFQSFFKTDQELVEETQLTLDSFKNAKKTLKKLGFIKTELKGTPPKTYYQIDIERLIDAIKKVHKINNLCNSHQLISGNYTNRFVEKPQIESAKNACISAGYTQDNTIDYNNRLLQNLSPDERETQNFLKKEKEKLLRDLARYIEPERLERIKHLPPKQLDILLFLIEEGRLNLCTIQDLYAYTKSLSEAEGYIPYHERRRRKHQLQKQREEERQRRSTPPPEEQVDPVEFKNFIQKFTKSFK